ncbi:MAG TPA: sigma-70 family RNA polymerase sigma factor [Acidimicrobiia bacterium]|nr:sigma-70 family RNA polymerase sigma factor [Acidimicrobiia bacterium]
MERAAGAERLELVQTVAPLAVRSEVLLDRLYRVHAPAALRFAVMLTGERELSEDLVQEAFVRVAAKLDSIREPDAFGAYLTRAVANLAKSHFRHQKVVARHERTIDVRSLVADPVDVVAGDALLVALRRLPIQQRAVLVLRYYNDCAHDEIARILDVPVGTVKSQLSRGLARLRREYGDA